MSVQDTSRVAYDAIRDSLPRRERAVWDALKQYTAAPTAYELTEGMKAHGMAFDLNSVRPRLTSLFQKRHIQRLGKRKCRVTGKSAYTWAVVFGRPPAPAPKTRPPEKGKPAEEARLF